MLKHTVLVASLVHVGEFLYGLIFLNQVKSACELHLPGDKGSVSGITGAPCTLLRATKVLETCIIQDVGMTLLSAVDISVGSAGSQEGRWSLASWPSEEAAVCAQAGSSGASGCLPTYASQQFTEGLCLHPKACEDSWRNALYSQNLPSSLVTSLGKMLPLPGKATCSSPFRISPALSLVPWEQV